MVDPLALDEQYSLRGTINHTGAVKPGMILWANYEDGTYFRIMTRENGSCRFSILVIDQVHSNGSNCTPYGRSLSARSVRGTNLIWMNSHVIWRLDCKTQDKHRFPHWLLIDSVIKTDKWILKEGGYLPWPFPLGHLVFPAIRLIFVLQAGVD